MDRNFWYGFPPVLKVRQADIRNSQGTLRFGYMYNIICRYIHAAYSYRKKAYLCEKKNLKWKDRG